MSHCEHLLGFPKREEIEKQKSKERYNKLHSEGKTEQARADLARLAIIKKQREDAAKKREELRKGEETTSRISTRLDLRISLKYPPGKELMESVQQENTCLVFIEFNSEDSDQLQRFSLSFGLL